MNFIIKVLWLENSLGVAVNQSNAGRSNLVTPYYFWPRNNAWDQVQKELNSKPWISKRQRILILNRISDIMNHWQKNRKQQNLVNVKVQFSDIDFVGTL
tara:strand:+ start:156 stop:452 length:297 start_codon:yes stop_codon:yes gene_type:complete